MNEKIKSPSGQGGGPPGGGSSGVPGGPTPPSQPCGGPPNIGGPSNNGSDSQSAPHPYGPLGCAPDPTMSHYHHHQQQAHAQQQQHHPHQQQSGPSGGGPPQNPGDHPHSKDDYVQSALSGPPPLPAGGHHPVYGRYHQLADPYSYAHSPMQQPPTGGKPQHQAPPPTGSIGPGGVGIASPSRPPPQRYIPGQPPQGPTPTLNSLLQSSHPPPPQHRYANSYDPQQQQQQPSSQQQQQQPGGPPQGPHGPPPPPHQPYGGQQGGWAPPPRPYSPQLGPSQAYRTPPPTNTSRGQSPYPPTHGQNSGSYPSSPQQQQQPGGPPPPPQSSNQGTAASQYSPYPQRYPTPPGPATGPNHRTAYSTHQYPEPNRPWPGGSSPAASPGPGGHPHPPASPHQAQHGGPNSSPGHAPSPSPQPSQASPSPHQELIGQNSNDSSSGGGHSGMGSGPPGTPNPQQVMRPTPSPTGSSGSRSMSPAVAQSHPISRPSSNQSSSGPMQQPGIPPHMSQSLGGGGGPPSSQQQQQQQQQSQQQSQLSGLGGGPQNSSTSSNSSQQPPTGSSGGGSGGSANTQQPQPPANQSVNSMPTQAAPGSAGGGYAPQPHMHGGYKMGPSAGPSPGPGPQGMTSGYPPPPQQTQQYSQGSYPPRPQYPPSSYAPTVPPPTNQSTSANNMPPGGPQQYTGRPIPNHSGGGGGPSPHSQFPPYQNWVPPSPQGHAGGAGVVAPPGSMVGNHIQNKGTPPPGSPLPPHSQSSSGSPRPLNYLKQHLQHKGGGGGGGGGGGCVGVYGASPTPPQGYGNGPGMHPGMPMGPPHHMGPPHGLTSMGPPTSTPPQGGGMLSGNIPPGAGIADVNAVSQPEHISQDNGISSSGSSASGGGLVGPHAVTSIITTGPDGTPIDDVSQQSTLSNASAASVEDPQCVTPKSRKNDPYSQSHLAPPSTSPGGVPHPPHPGIIGEEYEINSPPNWTRTPASPVFNSHVVPPQETFRTTTKKSDSLCKLYEMDDNPERRGWLDKLRSFMEERRTPITACPTISKQPLDLYRLYIYVKERGGFVEVTKSKTWKDIAGLLGIGASSSAAYTLRKHYTKNLLAFECHFDRGDIDPIPIIQQVEAGTKKKSTKAASVPSPGKSSSNSQDSFPAPGAAPNAAIDGYPGYPGGYPGSGAQPDYVAAGQIQRPPSQSNTQTPHAGNNTQAATAAGDNISVSNPFDDPVGAPPRAPPYQQGGTYAPVSRAQGSPYPGQPGAYGQYGAGDQYNSTGPPAGQFNQNQGQFPPQNRNMYPPYGPEGEAPQPGSNTYAPYGNRPYSQPPPGSAQSPTPPGANVSSPSGGPPTTGPGSATTSPYPPGTPGQQDYYRPPDQTPQPRRHPDFVKEAQPYPGYSTRPQMYGGWQSSSNQYRGQYPSSPSPQAWVASPQRTAAPGPGGPLGPPNQQAAAAAQWEQHRYAPQQAPPPQQQQQAPYQQQQQPSQQQPTPPPQWAQMGGAAGGSTQSAQAVIGPGSPLRPPNSQQQPQQQRMPSIGVPGIPPASQQQVIPPTVASGGPGTLPLPGNMTKQPPFAMPPPQNSSVGTPCGPGTVSGPPGTPPGPMLGASNNSNSSVAGIPPSSIGLVQKPTAPTHVQPQQPPSGGHQPASFATPPTAQLQKKEINFPPDSVEATTPVLYRRKRLVKSDVCPIDPWRLFMAMRSGLLTECTWALDVLNVLLFDDTTVQYFGLQHLPGLLTLLLEHFQKQLAEMFDDGDDLDDTDQETLAKNARSMKSICSYNRKRHHENNEDSDIRETKVISAHNLDGADCSDDEGIDLGQVRTAISPEERVLMLSNTPNYTMMSRKGLPVRIQAAESDIFVTDGQRVWDIDTNRLYEDTSPIGSNAWTYGSSERDRKDGIIDVFKSEIVDIPFARYIHNGRRNSSKRHEEKQRVSALHRKGHLKSAMTSEGDEESNNDADTTKLQQTFNKKRRMFNNTSSIKANESSTPNTVAKKSKIFDSGDEFVQPDLKRGAFLLSTTEHDTPGATAVIGVVTTLDSDCREVDMELEPAQRLANGYQSSAISSKTFDPRSTLRDPALVIQRRRDSSYEDECYTRDEASMYLVNESQDSLARRCICLSNIFRNLTFVPGNETILAKSSRFLAILGRLLLLNHEHLQRTPKTRNYDREEDTDFTDSCSSLQGEREWWWDYLISIRENMLVAMANIAGHLELSRYEELIARPLIDGLLHWAVCPSAHGQDPFPSCGPNTALSPQRLALESLCKLCVTDANVDLVIATPPHSRLEKLCAVLTRHLCRNEDQVLREFSVNLLHYLAAADSAMARTVALQSPCISYLVAFIEQAEQTALGVANQHGINYLRENPDSMGTSLDMLRRAAGTLLHLAKHPDNRSLFMQQEQRLLGLVMSHILDQQVALIISRVLFQVSRGPGPMPSMEYRMQQRQQQHQNDADKKSPPPATTTASEKITEAVKKSELQAETSAVNHQQHQQHELTNNSNSNCSTSSNASSSKPAVTASNDENSNSNLPPVATLNDVSNSSTNSSSCGAASSTSSHYGGVAANNSNSSSNTAAIATTMASVREQQQQHHQHQQQHLMSGNKNNISTTATITGNLSSSNNSSNFSSSSNSNSINNNNISSSNNSNLLSVAANATPTATTTTTTTLAAAAAAAAAAAVHQLPAAVTAAPETTSTAGAPTPTTAQNSTTAAVA